MLKNKVDFKLINLAILIFIIYLMYQTGSLWIGILAKLWEVLEPLLIAFAIAYALYPLKRYFMKQKVPKGLAIFCERKYNKKQLGQRGFGTCGSRHVTFGLLPF